MLFSFQWKKRNGLGWPGLVWHGLASETRTGPSRPKVSAYQYIWYLRWLRRRRRRVVRGIQLVRCTSSYTLHPSTSILPFSPGIFAAFKDWLRLRRTHVCTLMWIVGHCWWCCCCDYCCCCRFCCCWRSCWQLTFRMPYKSTSGHWKWQHT